MLPDTEKNCFLPTVPMVGRWKVHCLGELRVYRPDGSEIQWNRGGGATLKIKTIFAYLIQKGPLGGDIDEIADLLWPEAINIASSINRLYYEIHCLRALLSPGLSSRCCRYVTSRNKRYYLALPEDTWVDVPIFEQLCRQGQRFLSDGDLDRSLASLSTAEHLYSGSLFHDIPLKYIEGTESDWCWSKRFWLDKTYQEMLINLAIIYRRGGDFRKGLRCCKSVLQIDPCSEVAHQEAMRIYHLFGEREALQRQYRLCCESLKRFEDREPSSATLLLAHELIG